ncbi:A disintegrin and metalloproteinase with thrombospondin motifs 1 [Elysia marginata]|uniref:A disintegrin and metalloproteinase with thrombospondin motifs 1 n=1 Tax=Elysia marginata TaxID=1093978 RepID=A0AAV4HYR9_9GAST|nr:A disintegrin and metalloproteinase with thrombospondin motifs 1 [Elysia marginata]
MNLPRKLTPICLLLVVTLLHGATSVPVAVESEDSNPDARVRRDADSNLPDLLNFQVPLTEGEVTLRMKRSRLLPTATSHDDVITPFSENAAVYTDMDNGASMIVKRESGEYSMQGSFQHGHTEWHLEPLDRNKRQAAGNGESHRLFPGPPPDVQTISFIGDTVVDNEPPVEILNLADRNRHRMERMRNRQLRQGNNQNNNQREATDGERARGGNRRSKRDAIQHTVEMVFVVDRADYEKWVSFKGASNAIPEMTLWYTYVAEAINIRYRSINDPDIAMSTVVTFLRILTTETDDFIQDLISFSTFDGGAGLNAFRTWYQDPVNGIPNADHYMYFTGYDIRSASGIAFGSRVCTSSGVSITENSFTAGVGAVAAHELGHSLSAAHDSQTASCSDSTQNIMSTVFQLPVQTANTGNPWKFSSCSIDAFKSYLSSFTCTEPQNTGTADRLPAPTGNARAGLALDRNDQCRLYFRDNSSFYCSPTPRLCIIKQCLADVLFCRECKLRMAERKPFVVGCSVLFLAQVVSAVPCYPWSSLHVQLERSSNNNARTNNNDNNNDNNNNNNNNTRANYNPSTNNNDDNNNNTRANDNPSTDNNDDNNNTRTNNNNSGTNNHHRIANNNYYTGPNTTINHSVDIYNHSVYVYNHSVDIYNHSVDVYNDIHNHRETSRSDLNLRLHRLPQKLRYPRILDLLQVREKIDSLVSTFYSIVTLGFQTRRSEV